MTEATVTQLSDYRSHRAAMWALPAAPAAAPPTGTVTFLLTDIEGSAPRWESAPEAMGVAVARHYEILDIAVGRHGGVRPVEQGEGDSMVAVFAGAGSALAAALEAQRTMLAEQWPIGANLSVRMALHTGETQVRDQLYYVGPTIIRCARLRSLAHGGQVLLSGAVAELLATGLPEGSSLLPLGTHRLKGMTRPEQVFQLVHADLPVEFPPLRSPELAPTNLPVPVTSFVGRQAELAELAELTARHRLVSLAGPGGSGKTRLAIELGGEIAARFADGVWWVDLTALSDPDLLPRSVMTAVGLDATHDDPIGRLCAFLAGSRTLLMLDNAEHLRAEVGVLVAALLDRCAGLVTVVTSREPLGIAGELVWRVPPLPVPSIGDGEPDTAGILACASVRLFAERAAAARPGFAVDAGNAAVVAELCERLDGLPLALELAAARVRALTPDRILAGLAQRFALLAGASGVAAHQQTLLASMQWSHDLLTEPQQVLLRRLAVFAGRFGLEDVEAVAAAEPLRRWECLVLLADLVDRSLVAFDGEHYRLLATVAEFAAERLAEAGETGAVRARHLHHYRALVAASAAALDRAPGAEALERLEVARGNVLAAIEHALAIGDAEAALGLTGDMALFWQMHARYGESLAFLRRVLAATPDEPSPARARVLWAAGQQALFGMDLSNGYGLTEIQAALTMAETTSAGAVHARALCTMGMLAALTAPRSAPETLRAARALAEQADDAYGANVATVYLAFTLTFGLHRAEEATAELARLASVARHTGSPYWAIWQAICTGHLMVHTGRAAEAAEVLRPAVARAVDYGDSQLEFFAAWPLADALIDLGRTAEAEQVIARSVAWQDRSAIGRPEMMRTRRARSLLSRGAVAAARAELTAAAEVTCNVGFVFAEIEAFLLFARIAEAEGNAAAARAAVDEATARAEALGVVSLQTWTAVVEGRVARMEDRPVVAEEAHHRALALCARHGYVARAADALEGLASLAVGAESWAEAARLYGAASALRERCGVPRPVPDQPAAAADLTAVEKALGADGLATAMAAGATLDLAGAVAYAARARGERKRPSAGWDSLTPTEQQIVDLVAEGLTNAQIGERLFITTGTTKVHVHNIFTKLGVTRRSELAAQATRRRMSS